MSYLAFLTIATLIAAIGIVNDSAILVIGAMVLGPEFAPSPRSPPGRAARWAGTGRRY